MSTCLKVLGALYIVVAACVSLLVSHRDQTDIFESTVIGALGWLCAGLGCVLDELQKRRP